MDTDLLQQTFSALAPQAGDIAEEFYARLFAAGDKQLIDMFPAHMGQQRARLVGALVTIVAQAGDLDTLAGFLHDLGRHHRIYGRRPGDVRPEHFDLVGGCLLATLRAAAGAAWTPQVAETWAAAYALVAQVMIKGLTGDDGAPPWYGAEVTGAERRGLDISVVRARLDSGPRLTWAPGQSVGVQIESWPPGAGRQPPQAWRFYSPAHPPRDDNTMDLHIKRLPGGVLSVPLGRGSPPGTRLRVSPPVGALRLDESSARDVVMVAGSTGLAPLLAILEALAGRAQPPQVALFFGGRSPEDLYWDEELAKLAAGWPWLSVTCAVSGTAAETAGWAGPRGPVGDIAAAAGSWAGRDGYVCGGHQMTGAARAALARAGVSRVHVEDFGQGG